MLFGASSLAVLLGLVWFGISPAAKPVVVSASGQVVVEEEPAPAEAAVVPRTLVAKYPIKAGALLRAQDFRWEPLESSENIYLNDLFLEGFTEIESLAGSLLTRDLTALQTLSVSDIIRPEQSHYMSAMLSPGKRAVTLELSQAGASHGLLRPGNYVDVVLTSENDHANTQGSGVTTKRSASTVLENIRLLAIGNTLTDIVSSNDASRADIPLDNDSFKPVRVTFEVTPNGAARLLLAQKLGDLSLMLRSHYQPESESRSSRMASVWDQQISDNFNPVSPQHRPDNTIRIFDGSKIRSQSESTVK